VLKKIRQAAPADVTREVEQSQTGPPLTLPGNPKPKPFPVSAEQHAAASSMAHPSIEVARSFGMMPDHLADRGQFIPEACQGSCGGCALARNDCSSNEEKESKA
jgi:hypothetical protein